MKGAAGGGVEGQFKVLEVERLTQMGDILNKSSYGKMVLDLVEKDFC